MPRPGSRKYGIKRARIRKRLAAEGVAADAAAYERARTGLQREPRPRPQRVTERGQGPQGEW